MMLVAPIAAVMSGRQSRRYLNTSPACGLVMVIVACSMFVSSTSTILLSTSATGTAASSRDELRPGSRTRSGRIVAVEIEHRRVVHRRDVDGNLAVSVRGPPDPVLPLSAMDTTSVSGPEVVLVAAIDHAVECR